MALAYLALTFANLDRAALAGEVLDVLGPRAKTEPAGAGPPAAPLLGRARASTPGTAAAAETTALAALAYARVRPQAPELAGGGRLAAGPPRRRPAGSRTRPRARPWRRWPPSTAGPQAAEDRYRLVVTVNDAEVYAAEVVGPAEGKAIRRARARPSSPATATGSASTSRAGARSATPSR